MTNKKLKSFSQWFSLINAAISLIILVTLKSIRVFKSEDIASILFLTSMITAIIAFIFGIICLPRWQGFLVLAIVGYVGYCILFTSVLGIH